VLTVTIRDATTGAVVLVSGDRQLLDAVLAALAARLTEAGARLEPETALPEATEKQEGEEE